MFFYILPISQISRKLEIVNWVVHLLRLEMRDWRTVKLEGRLGKELW